MDHQIAQLGIAAANADDLWTAALCQCALGRTPTPLGRVNVSAPQARAILLGVFGERLGGAG